MAPQQHDHPTIAVIGAGPAGLMAAEAAARAGARVAIYDAMPSAGRKFLMAGRSGLNITHSEPFDAFVRRYGAAADWLRPMLERFSPDDMRAFCADLGVETFVGSSGRVFPRTMKASPLLRAWLRRLAEMGVEFRASARLTDISPEPSWPGSSRPSTPNRAAQGVETDGGVCDRAPSGPAWMPATSAGMTARVGFDLLDPAGATETVFVDAVVLALGGASWPRLGSTGAWTRMLADKDIAMAPFRPSNCGIEIDWSETFRERFAGQPIKTACFSFDARSVRGEAVVTRRGLEGGPVYALASAIGDALRNGESAHLTIDLKPDSAVEALARKIETRRKGDSFSNSVRKSLGLSPLAVSLLREVSPDVATLNASELAHLVKNMSLDVRAVAGLDRAISTAGGVMRDEIDEHLMLKKLPGVFVAGEMIDWDAPTGGYLLQACFATGKAAGEGAARFASLPDR